MGKFLMRFLLFFLVACALLNSFSIIVLADDDKGGGNSFVQDPRVTFSGKFASRASNFLDWALGDYNWASPNSGSKAPLAEAWNQNRNLVYLSLVAFIMTAGFIMIASRGKSVSASRFLPTLLFIAIAVTFSYSLIRLLYQLTDIVSLFFLHDPAHNPLGAGSLLKIDPPGGYVNFTGYRLADPVYDESVFSTLSLIELTAITYYILGAILLFRKIVLWFFILLSPFFPFIAFFPPMRNTAVAWSKHFFRWLLYGPIFAILFSGLIFIWTAGIPLKFDFTGLGKFQLIAYPTATNIYLAGPTQLGSPNNSLNTVDSYAYFIVALLMLWVVIVLPYFLSKVSFDYMKNLAATHLATNQFVQSVATRYREMGMPKNSSTQANVATPPVDKKYYSPGEKV